MSRSDIKIGFACNNRCVFCAQGEKRHDTGFVPFDTVVAHLRRRYREGQGLVFTGGEPTIRKDLIELVTLAKGIGYAPIQLQTNGRMLIYRQRVRRLVDAGVTEFAPSLHGPNADVHEQLTRAAGSFEQSLAGIANAVASGVPVVTNTVVCRQNIEHLAATVELLASAGVTHAQLAMVHPVGTAAGLFTQIVPHLSVAAPAVAAAVRRGTSLGVRVVVEAMPPCFLRGLEHAIVESAIPETTVIDANGQQFAYSDWRRGEGKIKGPPCETCACAQTCEGPWREYPEQFGWDHYVPYN